MWPNSPARKGGRWYLADNGHAVYCYGPVRVLPQPEGGLQRVATFCQGDKKRSTASRLESADGIIPKQS